VRVLGEGDRRGWDAGIEQRRRTGIVELFWLCLSCEQRREVVDTIE
jgi:hypothetical protein